MYLEDSIIETGIPVFMGFCYIFISAGPVLEVLQLII